MKYFFLFLSLFLSSCVIPYTAQIHLGENMKGRVVDAESGKGIVDATVRYKELTSYETRTDEDGYFLLEEQAPQKKYWMPPAPVDPPPWAFDSSSYILVIVAPGYEQQEFERVKYRVFVPAGESSETKKGPEYFLFPLKASK